MSTLKYIRKIIRPTQVIIGGLSTWVVALLSNGPTWINQQNVSAGIVMSLSILSAGIWHYGARHDVYARKWWDPIYIKNPNMLRVIGASGFLVSVVVSLNFLPTGCTTIALLNAAIIILYAKRLDQFWPWKNIIIAGVCITPLAMGWFSGHRLNPILPPLMGAAFFIYLAREILKDIVDREANQGKRFTMVMSLGISASLKVAGIVLAIAPLLVGYSLSNQKIPMSSWIFFSVGGIFLLLFSLLLMTGKDLSKKFSHIDLGVASMLIALIIIRASMY